MPKSSYPYVICEGHQVPKVKAISFLNKQVYKTQLFTTERISTKSQSPRQELPSNIFKGLYVPSKSKHVSCSCYSPNKFVLIFS